MILVEFLRTQDIEQLDPTIDQRSHLASFVDLMRHVVLPHALGASIPNGPARPTSDSVGSAAAASDTIQWAFSPRIPLEPAGASWIREGASDRIPSELRKRSRRGSRDAYAPRRRTARERIFPTT
jgi:hypothetical protein